MQRKIVTLDWWNKLLPIALILTGGSITAIGLAADLLNLGGPQGIGPNQVALAMSGFAVLLSGVAAVEIRKSSLETFVANVRAVCPGRRLAITKLRALYARTATSIGLTQGVEAIQFAVRLHLRILENARLVRYERQGRSRVYTVDKERLGLVSEWLRWFDPAAAKALEDEMPKESRARARQAGNFKVR